MTRKFLGVLALGLALVGGLFAVRAVYAQATGGMGGMKGMMSMMEDCPMMGAMAQSPAAVLRQREALGLTDVQAKQISALQDATKRAGAQAMTQMRAVHQEIEKASAGENFDEQAARSAFDRMGKLHTEMGVAMLRARQQVRQLLTPEQRPKLEGMADGRMGRGGMMGMMSAMQDCPMMQGGMMGGMEGMHMQSPADSTRR